MAETYISSGSIICFPAINRSADYFASARSLSEQNLVNFVNPEIQDYIISTSTQDNPFIFCIKGRLIAVDNPSGTTQSTLYATAHVDSTTGLMIGDDGTQFKGVSFDDTGDFCLISGGQVYAPNLYQNKVIANSDIIVNGGTIS